MVCASLVLSFGQLQPPVCEPYEALFCPDSSHITPLGRLHRGAGEVFWMGVPGLGERKKPSGWLEDLAGSNSQQPRTKDGFSVTKIQEYPGLT